MLIALAALLAAPAAARACDTIPAGFADGVRVREDLRQGTRADHSATLLCVRTGGRRVVLRRASATLPYRGHPTGTVVDAAAATGRRVAWIETRFPRGRRLVVVRVVRVGTRGRVRLLRRLVVARDHSDRTASLDVLITARGELAWLAPYYDAGNRVVFDPPRGRPRSVGRTGGEELWIEDRRTLAWYGSDGYGFHDMRRPPGPGCPRRSRFHAVAANDAVVVTQAGYADGEREVLRACLRATGRDPVIAQADNGLGNGDSVEVAGLDRHWVLLVRSEFTRYDTCLGAYRQRPLDARDGHAGRLTGAPLCGDGPPLARLGAPLAVTDRGVPGWVAEQDGVQRLLVAARGGGVAELDRGAIAGLRAQGRAAIAWTRDGVPRSAVLP